MTLFAYNIKMDTTTNFMYIRSKFQLLEIHSLMSRKVNDILSKKFRWFFFVVVFCIIPYFIRIGFSVSWNDQLEGFYISEMDILCFCIAVMVHLFSELNELNKLPLDLEQNVVQGILMLYIIGLFAGVYFSLDFEHNIIFYKDKYIEALVKQRPTNEIRDILDIKNGIESKKFTLWFISCFVGLMTPFLSYKILFHKENA